MNLAQRLRAIVEAMPETGAITLPVSELEKWLAEEQMSASRPLGSTTSCDLTVDEVAERIGRRPGTVREWVRTGQLEGYLFRDRQYRVTETALQSFMESQRQRSGAGKADRCEVLGRPKATDLSAWRKVRKVGGTG